MNSTKSIIRATRHQREMANMVDKSVAWDAAVSVPEKTAKELAQLRSRVDALESALEAYVSDFCEGFCAELPLDYADDVMLNDCSGCRARVCLATEPKP